MKILKNNKVRISMIAIIIVILLSIFSFFAYSYFSMNMSLVGDSIITLNYGEKYKEPGFKATVLGKNTSKKVNVKSNLKKDVGTYKIVYNYSFLFFKIIKNRNIKIVDKEKPIIELTDGELIQIYQNESYNEPGFKATDNKDGDLTEKVEVNGSVDTSNIGEYTLEYTVKDSSGNSTKTKRKVSVIKDDRYQNKINYSNGGSNGNFVIAGDSNIKNMYFNGYVDSGKAWAIPCLHAQSMQSTAVNIYGTNTQMTIVEAASTYKPDTLVLYFGAFSTAWISEAEFDQGSATMINEIKRVSPNTKIYLLSILPITQYGPNINNFNQKTIDYYNTKISKIAASNGLSYLNAQAVLKDDAGYGDPNYYVGDGYHLNSNGHRMLRNYINANL